MEAASEAGEILLSCRDRGAPRAERRSREQKGGGRLLRAAPDVRELGRAATSASKASRSRSRSPRHCAPSFSRSDRSKASTATRRSRSSASRGTDEIIATEGPEAAADALDALVRAVQAAAEEHRVTFLESDIDRDGGRIVLVSGAPQTFGDDEERMLRTVRAIVDAGLPLRCTSASAKDASSRARSARASAGRTPCRRAEFWRDVLSLELLAKVALGNTHREVVINGSTTVTAPACHPL